MASIKDLKKRIGTVKNTQQTTRAMKMVSAAKLRRAQDAILNHRAYANGILHLIHELSTKVKGGDKNPLLGRKLPEGQNKKILFLLITSDRGLCGGFNGNVIKACQRWMNEVSDVELCFIGKKGYEHFKNRNVHVGQYFIEANGKVTYAKAQKVAKILFDRYMHGEIDEIKIIYNQFKNALTQQPHIENFLPLQKSHGDESQNLIPYIIRPSSKELLDKLLEKNFGIQMFKVLLDSQAGEHGARMAAMENATKNAGEMIQQLTLEFNKQRQASITKELLEIIAGSESQKA